jgi:hypothetical protein
MSVEKNPDLLRRSQLVGDAEKEEWEEYQHLLVEFEKGIRFVLRRGVSQDVMHDLSSECFALYVQTCGKWSPQSYGKDVANKWLRENFKEVELSTSEGETKVWTAKSPTFESLTRQTDEGESITFDVVDDPALEPEGWMGKDKPYEPFMPENYSLFRATADYEICLQYLARKGKRGNHFTRAESVAFESAMRRLRKLASKS